MITNFTPRFPVISYSVFRSIFNSGGSIAYTTTGDSYVATCSLNQNYFSCFISLPSDIVDFEQNIKTFATSTNSYNDAEALVLVAGQYENTISPQTIRYDIQTNAIYVGTAKAGSLTSDTVWTIQRTILSSGSPTYRQSTASSAAVWDNRTTETYY